MTVDDPNRTVKNIKSDLPQRRWGAEKNTTNNAYNRRLYARIGHTLQAVLPMLSETLAFILSYKIMFFSAPQRLCGESFWRGFEWVLMAVFSLSIQTPEGLLSGLDMCCLSIVMAMSFNCNKWQVLLTGKVVIYFIINDVDIADVKVKVFTNR